MKHFVLKGQVREVGNKAVIKEYRKQGLVPCNIYGSGVENILFTVTEKDLKGLTDTPASYIVDLAQQRPEIQCSYPRASVSPGKGQLPSRRFPRCQ